MSVKKRSKRKGAPVEAQVVTPQVGAGHEAVLEDVSAVVATARGAAARSVGSIMTAAYWLIGRRIVEHEQRGRRRAGYGELLMDTLEADLTKRHGRGFGRTNLFDMREFYLAHSDIVRRVSGKSGPTGAIVRTLSGQSSDRPDPLAVAAALPLTWSHYVLLLRRARTEAARKFYEAEALRGGWSVRQLARQVDSQFYERTALSRDKVAMLEKGSKPRPEDQVSPEEAIKDPFVLEFLGLKDEDSESDLEQALILNLEQFLLELGEDFCFVARQKRLRIGDEWYRVDLLFFHRRLRCLVVIDLKVGRFTHADAGQMAMYLQYAKEHWTNDGEGAPVGLILCSSKDRSVAHYALAGLKERVIASEYLPALPSEEELAAHLAEARKMLAQRGEP